jgi:hypothetical protein
MRRENVVVEGERERAKAKPNTAQVETHREGRTIPVGLAATSARHNKNKQNKQDENI